MNICNNCKSTFDGKFCNHCGQKANVGELSLHDVAHEIWHSFTHTDSGILRLLKDLFLHPREVYLNYFSGQRKKYFSPVTFFLITVGILLFLGIKIYDYQDTKFNTLNEFGRYSLLETKFKFLILLPIQVLTTFLLFHKRYNLAKNIVFWLYLNGFLFTIKILFTPIYFIFIQYKDTIDLIVSITVIGFSFLHLITVFSNRKWINYILLFIIMNLIYICDHIITGYLLLGDKLYKATGVSNFWEFILLAYHS